MEPGLSCNIFPLHRTDIPGTTVLTAVPIVPKHEIFITAQSDLIFCDTRIGYLIIASLI